MLRVLVAAATILTSPSEARYRPHEYGHAMNVASGYESSFAGLVSEFQAMGYATGTPGCLSSGHMRRSKHHWGGACDLFNQVSRNRTALRQPPPAVQVAVAARHGLTSGCAWRSPDCGHFEVPGAGRAMYYERRRPVRYRIRYAAG